MLAALASTGLLFMIYTFAPLLQPLAQTLLSTGLDTLNSLPSWSLLPALSLLPLVGIPISPLYIIVGLRLDPFLASLTLSLGIGLNLLLSYAIASGPLRNFLLRRFPKKHLDLPTKASPISLILWVRLSPLPFLAQNLTLGALRTPFKLYMALSWPIQLLFGFAFAFAGKSAQTGHLPHILLALFFILTLHLALTFCKKRKTITRLQSTL